MLSHPVVKLVDISYSICHNIMVKEDIRAALVRVEAVYHSRAVRAGGSAEAVDIVVAHFRRLGPILITLLTESINSSCVLKDGTDLFHPVIVYMVKS